MLPYAFITHCSKLVPPILKLNTASVSVLNGGGSRVLVAVYACPFYQDLPHLPVGAGLRIININRPEINVN
jgi:hypothetical protein